MKDIHRAFAPFGGSHTGNNNVVASVVHTEIECRIVKRSIGIGASSLGEGTSFFTGFGGSPFLVPVDDFPHISVCIELSEPIRGDLSAISFEIEGFCSPGKWIPDQTNDDYQTIRPFAKVRYGYFRSTYSLIWRFYKAWAIHNNLRGQISSTNLLPSEQYGLGGYNTVRGYPEREYNSDDAFIYNIEMRTPLLYVKAVK